MGFGLIVPGVRPRVFFWGLMSKRVIFFIDGFNVYHSIDDLVSVDSKNTIYKWIDYSKFAQCFVNDDEEIKDIYYFTSLCPWDPNRQKRHQILIRALKHRNIKIVFGEFKKRRKQYNNYRVNVVLKYHEEKKTDVNIAVLLLKLAFEDKYDTAIIISGDTDFSLAITEIKKSFPEKKIGIVFPIGRRNNALEKLADFHKVVTKKHLESSRFPDTIDIGEGTSLFCPPEWKEPT